MGTMHFYPLEVFSQVLEWIWQRQRTISTEVYLTAASAKAPVPALEGKLVFAVNAAAFYAT